MFNHARTLFLNLPKTSDFDQIPANYSPINLPSALQNFYNELIPLNSSTEQKKFLVHCFLNIIDSVGLTSEIELFDSRITYSLTDETFFGVNKLSDIKTNNSHNLNITGELNYNNELIATTYEFEIGQVGATSNIYIYSTTDNTYYGQSSKSNSPIGIALTFNDGISNVVKIFNTGIQFTISENTDFTASPNKRWSFVVQTKFEFDTYKLFMKLKASKATEQMINHLSELNNPNYLNLWNQHYNYLYRLAGLFLVYLNKVNSYVRY